MELPFQAGLLIGLRTLNTWVTIGVAAVELSGAARGFRGMALPESWEVTCHSHKAIGRSIVRFIVKGLG